MKDSNPQISIWRRAVCAISLIPRKTKSQFSKTNKKPRPGSGSGARRTHALRPSRHDSPNDPLAGHSDYVVFEGPKHCVDPVLTSSYYYNTTYGASGRIRTCVHFVRSEGHPSSLARTLKSGQGRRISTFDAASQAQSVGKLHHTLQMVGEREN